LFLGVPTNLHQRDVCEPGGLESAYPGDMLLDVGPQGIWLDTSSSRTVFDAASNDAGTGSSAFTLQLPVNQRN
jgi:hypothetical protein